MLDTPERLPAGESARAPHTSRAAAASPLEHVGAPHGAKLGTSTRGALTGAQGCMAAGISAGPGPGAKVVPVTKGFAARAPVCPPT